MMATKYLVLAFAAFIVQAAAQCPCNNGQGQLVSTQQFISPPQQVVTSSPCGCQEQYVVISPQQIVRNSPCGCQAPQQIVSSPCGCQAPPQILSSPCGCQATPQILSSPCGCQAPPQILSSPCGCQAPPQILSSPCGCQTPQLVPTQQYVANAPQIVASSPCGCQSQQLVSSQVVASPQVKQACASPLYATPVVATTLIDNSVSNSLANALQLLIVSDLIETTLNARDCSTNQIISNCDGSFVETFTEYVPTCQQSCNGPIEIDFVDSYGPVEYFSNGYQEVITPVTQLAPSVAEVVFPASIPAQLVCQFSYVPTTVPVVSVDVQPLPSGYGSCISGCGCGVSSGSSCGCNGPSYYY